MINIGGLGDKLNPMMKNEQKKPQKAGKPEEKSAAAKKEKTDKIDFTSLDGAASQKTQGTAGTYEKFRVQSKSGQSEQTKLSKTAQDYLEKLKKKYGNMDFIIADFSGDEEADRLLAQGKGEYNVLISPDLLEKMAADDAVAAKYEGMIDDSVESIKSVKQELGEDTDMVEKYGVSVDKDGNLSLRAKLIEGLVDKDGNDTVRGNTVDELLDRLNEVKEANAEKIAKLREAKKAEAEKTDETGDKEDADDESGTELDKLNNSKKQILAQLKALGKDGDRTELMDKLREIESRLAHLNKKS